MWRIVENEEKLLFSCLVLEKQQVTVRVEVSPAEVSLLTRVSRILSPFGSLLFFSLVPIGYFAFSPPFEASLANTQITERSGQP